MPDDAPPSADSTSLRSQPGAGSTGSTRWAPPERTSSSASGGSTEASARLGDGESFGVVGDGSGAGGDGGWLAHPALVDIATGFGILLTRPEAAEQLHVPVGYDTVRWNAPVSAGCAVHATRRPDSTADLLRVDLAITDATGLVAVRIDGLQLRPLADPATLGATVSERRARVAADRRRSARPRRAARAPTRRGDDVAGSSGRLDTRPADRDARSISTPSARSADGVDDDGCARTGTSPSGGATLEQRLTAMWQELLGVDSVGPDDDFFDLGGHSLMAIRLMTRIKRDLGVRFDLSAIFDASTVSVLAARIRERTAGHRRRARSIRRPAADGIVRRRSTAGQHAERKQLVTISSRGIGRPLYVVHGAGGNVLFLSTLTRAMGGDRPVHAFQAVGVNDGEIPDASIEAMASRYVAELRAHSHRSVPARRLLGRRHRRARDGAPAARTR